MMKAAAAPERSTALREAARELARGNVERAEGVLKRLTAQRKNDAEAHHLLSIVANMRGLGPEAVTHAERALTLNARHADFHFAHGRALKTTGRIEAAIGAYQRALALDPSHADVLVSLGIALRAQGRLADAARAHRRALALRPHFPEALSNLGNVLAEIVGHAVGGQPTAEDLRGAEDVQRRALALAPRDPTLLHNLAVTCNLTGRYDEAAELLNNALGLDPSRVDTCLLFGSILVGESRLDLARQLYVRWLRDQQAHPAVMLRLASLLADLGEPNEAASLLERVLALAPSSAEADGLRERLRVGQLSSDLGGEQALASYRSAIEARPDYFEGVCSYLLTLCYLEEDPQALLAEHRARLLPLSAPAYLRHHIPVTSTRRVRVGYVSSDLKRHSVAYFLEAILEAHDRGRIEIFAYKGNAGGDAVTARLRDLCDHWLECGALSDAQLAERIVDDDIDVLVDLSGLSSGARLGVFGRRPARCQITYLGYPTSTGASCFDARITDAVIDPAGAEPFSSEPLLRTPGTMFCYRPGPLPEVAALPATSAGLITFGSFNNLAKVERHTLALWRDVLLAVPRSRLLLKSQALVQHGNRELLKAHFAGQGIDPARIEVQPWQPDVQAHLATYGRVDIALDTFPFNGATTTCEALVMGVPTLTLRGRTHPSRMGASILGAVGLADFVATDDVGFVDRAVALAADVAGLAALRAGLRARVLASPLTDGPAFARAFERLLLDALDAAVRPAPVVAG